MTPTRKLPHYCWDFIALSPEQRHEAEHKQSRDVDPPSDFVTIVDHECPHAEPGAAQAQPYLMETRAGISVRAVRTGNSPLCGQLASCLGALERPAIRIGMEGAGAGHLRGLK
jgi:hypothetical protein